MHEQMRSSSRLSRKITTKGQDRFDILSTRNDTIGQPFDDIIESQLDTLMLAECPECGRFRRAGVEDR